MVLGWGERRPRSFDVDTQRRKISSTSSTRKKRAVKLAILISQMERQSDTNINTKLLAVCCADTKQKTTHKKNTQHQQTRSKSTLMSYTPKKKKKKIWTKNINEKIKMMPDLKIWNGRYEHIKLFHIFTSRFSTNVQQAL